MKFPLISLAFVLVFFFVSSAAIATKTGGSYTGISEYPSHTCSAPTKPIEPDSFSEQGKVDQYNVKVDNYNSQIRTYTDCIRGYVDIAKNDIKKIRKRITEAINEANSQ